MLGVVQFFDVVDVEFVDFSEFLHFGFEFDDVVL